MGRVGGGDVGGERRILLSSSPSEVVLACCFFMLLLIICGRHLKSTNNTVILGRTSCRRSGSGHEPLLIIITTHCRILSILPLPEQDHMDQTRKRQKHHLSIEFPTADDEQEEHGG